MAFAVPVACKVLRRGCDDDADFEDVTLQVNLEEDTVGTAKANAQMPGFVIYFGEILKDTDRFRTFYDGKEKLIILDCGAGWVEDEDDIDTANPANRIAKQGFSISHTLKALGRSVWHEGMEEFAQSAHLIKRLIDEAGMENYQNRSECLTTSDISGNLETVGVFNEYEESTLYFPPEVGVDDTGDEHIESNMNGLIPKVSEETKAKLRESRRKVISQTPVLERAALAVVRMLGWHPVSKAEAVGPQAPSINLSTIQKDTCATAMNWSATEEEEDAASKKYRILPFTGFFVTPTLIMATKSCSYSKEHHSYAVKYMFTRRPRCTYNFLRPGTDLLPCSIVRGVTNTLVERIRKIGVEVPEDIIPPDNMATRWSDLLLFEVPEEHRSEVYLIPESDPILAGSMVASIAYHARPSEKWVEEANIEEGKGEPNFSERDMSDHFWKYDIKCCSVGIAKSDEMDGVVDHRCCLLPSSTGSPLLDKFQPVDSTNNVFSFSAINCGRLHAEILLAEASGGSKRHNCAMTVRNLAFVLVYQQYIAPKLVREECYGRIKKFLQPFKILAEKERLHACHVKMLKDADEFNEYGMAFYEAQQLKNAMQCFREGARMFSIANIPDQTDYDLKLKDALQSNVSSVIMSLRDLGHLE